MQKLRNTCFYLDIYFKQNEWSVFYSFHFGAHLALNFDIYHDNDPISTDIFWAIIALTLMMKMVS